MSSFTSDFNIDDVFAKSFDDKKPKLVAVKLEKGSFKEPIAKKRSKDKHV